MEQRKAEIPENNSILEGPEKSLLKVVGKPKSARNIKILVIQQKMIGDVLTSTVIGEALRKKFPNATIHYLINTSTIPVVKGNPFFDKIIEFKKEYRDHKLEFYKFLRSVKKEEYTHVYDAYAKIESNLISLASGAPKRISFYKWYTYFMYTKTIKRKPISITNASSAIENRLRLVYSKENTLKDQIIRPKIFLEQKEKKQARKFIESKGVILKNQPLVMISVMGSKLIKSLPFGYMAKVIDKVAEAIPGTIIFNYIPDQKEDALRIYEMTSNKTKEKINLEVFGKSLREFIAILSHCDVLIGNEGGAVNMAKALNKPTFTIFSPWIKKQEWNMFEDGKQHDSVHLMDYKPELYGEKIPKELKDQALEMYKHFTPDLFLPKLKNYIQNLNF